MWALRLGGDSTLRGGQNRRLRALAMERCWFSCFSRARCSPRWWARREAPFLFNMRAGLALIAAAISCLSPAATGQIKAAWTVVSSGEMDVRIQHQLQQLAAQNGTSLRWLGKTGHKARLAHSSGSLSIELDTAPKPAAFLAELKRFARSSEVKPTTELANEGYILRCSYSRGTASAHAAPSRIRIRAVSAAGFHNALLRIPDLLTSDASQLSTDLIPRPQSLHLQKEGAMAIIADYPSFPLRGVVEGFYGPPWSHADRLELLRFEGQHGMNIYIYGPKDDPYHRKLWREPYPPEQLKRLGDLADTARENFVDFSFAISPGLSMVYSSDADFQTLARKLETVAWLGVSNFALFLDDVPPDLVHAEDRARFKTLAQAHIQLINRLYGHLQSLSTNNRLTVCPTTYTNGWGNRDYIKELGAGVSAAVPLVWTGTETIPRTITVAQAEDWGGYLRRKPLVWDNYPVNDDNPWWLNLHPLRGRDARLFAATQGLFSNPMIHPRASLLPLQTVADYLWNPLAYDPEKSQRHALVNQYGPDAPDILAPLLEIFRSDKDGSVFQSIFEESWNPIDIPAADLQIARLTSLVALLKAQPRFEKLVSEISPLTNVLRDRLSRVRNDPMFAQLPGGKLQWDQERDVLGASRVLSKPVLDGDFSKWESGPLYLLNDDSQIADGKTLWKGPTQFSTRVALAWDEDNLYIAADVTDPDLYQPFWGRDVQNGDAFRLIFETAQPQGGPGGPIDAYDLYLSPGNFADVKPSIYCEEDYLPPRPKPHNYNEEIKTAWARTSKGFSGEVAIPISFFAARRFTMGQEIGLSFGAQKTFPPKDPSGDNLLQIVFTSKRDPLFRVDAGNPSTLQRLRLVDSR